ncbi:MAG: D-tyrosyl-tRNA(Tyr) deacylase [Methylococcales bacterium]|nr:D-tyrosyl-tRNA(Tyr) deacylase [Methylococcales bacterium]
MLTIIQRVTEANVIVNHQQIGSISQGIMALVAIEKEDVEADADWLLAKILSYRIFSDENDKMNLSLSDIQGGLLVVPQFTLAANTQSGNRPSFSAAASPARGKELFSYFCEQASRQYPQTEFGQFGADMKVSLINDGPVTFTLRTKPKH